MYTIISGTNRVNSHTEKVAIEYQKILKEKDIEASVFDLKDIDVLNKNPVFEKIEKDILQPTQKFIFIIPEYNGSYPGVLKAMIDLTEVEKTWWWKKALLTGIATGRAGNLRGMDHMNDSLQHMNVFVHPNKLPISLIDKLIDEKGVIHNELTLKAINKQLDEFIRF
jgi:NAD(P)H-dependent FMN reductase